jgi:hypothetical protein
MKGEDVRMLLKALAAGLEIVRLWMIEELDTIKYKS